MDMMPIANKLEMEALGNQGTTLFVNFMPMECKHGILLRSPLEGTKVNHEMPGYYKTEFKVIVRSHDYMTAAGLMKDVMTALVLYEQQLDDAFFKYVRPSTLPVTFPVSEGNFFEIQVGFDACFVGETYEPVR